MNRLADEYRTAFVTGASTGLGQAFAAMLRDEGLEVWGTSRRADRLAPAPHFHALTFDLADGAAAEHGFADAARAAGGFDVVVNNAGYSVFGPFAGTEFAVWQAQMEAMLVTTARIAHAALRGMRERDRGTLVNVSSMAAEFPLPYQSAYNMTKAGLSALSLSLLTEVAGTRVRVIDLRPGDYRTDFDGSVRRAPETFTPQMARVWDAFARMMRTGPAPARAAADLRRALLARRHGTVRTGRAFQTVIGPLLARAVPASWSRYFQERYFGVRP